MTGRIGEERGKGREEKGKRRRGKDGKSPYRHSFLGGIGHVQAIPPIATHFSAAWSVCRLSSVTLVHPAYPFDGLRCHLAGTLVTRHLTWTFGGDATVLADYALTTTTNERLQVMPQSSLMCCQNVPNNWCKINRTKWTTATTVQ